MLPGLRIRTPGVRPTSSRQANKSVDKVLAATPDPLSDMKDDRTGHHECFFKGWMIQCPPTHTRTHTHTHTHTHSHGCGPGWTVAGNIMRQGLLLDRKGADERVNAKIKW